MKTIDSDTLSFKRGAVRPCSLSTFCPRPTSTALLAPQPLEITLKIAPVSAGAITLTLSQLRQYLIIIRYLSVNVNPKISRKILTCKYLQHFPFAASKTIITLKLPARPPLFSPSACSAYCAHSASWVARISAHPSRAFLQKFCCSTRTKKVHGLPVDVLRRSSVAVLSSRICSRLGNSKNQPLPFF